MLILIVNIKKYTKDVVKALEFILLSLIFLISVILVKYKPVYKVSLAGETLGYVKEKSELENKINEYTSSKTENIVLIDIEQKPEYEFSLEPKKLETEEEEILEKIEETAVITYRTYAVTVNGESKTQVNTEEEASEIVSNLQESSVPAGVEFNLGIVEVYSEEEIGVKKEEALNTLTDIKIAKVNEYEQEQERIKAEQINAKKASWIPQIATTSYGSYGIVNGISITNPLKANVLITSRFGEISSSRSSVHTGLDLATSVGTPIYPIAGGTVTFTGWQGSYGNLIIINHGNGVESYYAHCNSINVGTGSEVTADTLIGTVGSTGNSTGPHLHLEIRVNGTICNPQNYLY